MSIDTPLTKELVQRPEMWQLSMRLSPTALDVLLYSPAENNSLIYRQFQLDPTCENSLAELEDAVYANPLLLEGFGRISMVVDTSTVLPVPAEIDNPDDRETLMETVFPDFTGRIFTNPTGAPDATLLFGVDEDVAGFIERTFFDVRIYHHLSPLSCYFMTSGRRANNCRVYANLRDKAVDLIAIDHGKLLMINTMSFETAADAVYYILACYHAASLDMMTTELLVSGSTTMRDEVVPVLRNYIASVMPVIFPSAMFKAGRDALKAPFDLIVLPLSSQ